MRHLNVKARSLRYWLAPAGIVGVALLLLAAWSQVQPQSLLAYACTNNARFVDDISIPDNTVIAPGESFQRVIGQSRA